MDKNLRPYVISCDWLQLYLHKTSHFDPTAENLFGYQFVDVGHGSKVFKNIYNVVEPTGELLGNISLNPYSSKIPAQAVIFKAENNVLYQEDFVARIFEFVSCCGLHYRGITRLDIAYDSNELYGGLKHQTLIKKYRSNEYLKIGCREYFMHCRAGYHLSIDKKGRKILSDKEPDKKNESSQAAGVKQSNIQNLGEHTTNSITWGSRSSDTQIQIYDKSKELREVKMKHYIVDTWKAAGLDIERPVYRIEIRIVNEGKSLQNLKTGEKFTLSMNDLVTQELIEQLFHDYMKKKFRFYHRRDIQKIQQMKEVKLFSLTNKPVHRPKRNTKRKDYTRMTKIVINELEKHIAENSKSENMLTHELERVHEYLVQTYQMEKWVKEREDEGYYLETMGKRSEMSVTEYYKQRYAGISGVVAKRAAERRTRIEEQIRMMQEAVADEAEDISLDMQFDIFRMEGYK